MEWLEQCSAKIDGAEATIAAAKGMWSSAIIGTLRDAARGKPPKSLPEFGVRVIVSVASGAGKKYCQAGEQKMHVMLIKTICVFLSAVVIFILGWYGERLSLLIGMRFVDSIWFAVLAAMTTFWISEYFLKKIAK